MDESWRWLALACANRALGEAECIHAWAYSGPLGARAGLFFGLVGARAGTNDSRRNEIALVATALLAVLGHRGDAASLLPKHMASTVDNSAGQTQTNKINVARQCAANLVSCSAMSPLIQMIARSNKLVSCIDWVTVDHL